MENEDRQGCVGVTAFEGTRHNPQKHTAEDAPSEVKFMAARSAAHLMQCPVKAPTGWDCHETPFRCGSNKSSGWGIQRQLDSQGNVGLAISDLSPATVLATQ